MTDSRIDIAKPLLGEPEWQAARAVIESGWVTQGAKVAAFEEELAAICGAPHAVAMSSCTAALHLALLVAGAGPGDEVIVPSMSFIATANAVVHAGATPVFAEVDPVTFNLDLADVERRLGPRSKAILLVHQLGYPADIQGFTQLAAAHGVALVEDAACAIGSTYDGVPIGGHSELVCFSFHPRKLLTTGDGGMVLTTSSEHAERLRRLRQHAMSVPDTVRHAASTIIQEQYVEVGYNYRLTDIQAAIGLEQLRRLPSLVEVRQALRGAYDDALAEVPGVGTPADDERVGWNVQSYAVRLESCDAAGRDAVMQDLLDQGIATRRGVMTAHREPAYAHVGASLPVSEAASDGSLILPLHHELTDHDIERVASALAAAVRRR